MTRLARVVLGLAVVWMVALLILMLLRAGFPLELEWMEGGSLHQAQRMLDGKPIYAEPSVDFVPFLYTPLYPALVAAVGSVFGVSYLVARLVSILSVVAIVLGLRQALRNELDDPVAQGWLPWVAPGLFCAGYVFTFRWLDTARADALYLALAVWGLVLLRGATRQAPSRSVMLRTAGAGVLLGLAFWTKQTAALFIVAAGLWALRCSLKHAAVLVFSVGLVDGVGVLIGQSLTEGWLWTYIYELHQGHGFNRVRFTKKTWGMFGHAAPFMAMLLAWRLARGVQAWRQRRGETRGPAVPASGGSALGFWSLMFAAALLASALGYSTQWAEPNAFLPGVAVGSVVCVLVLPVRGRAAGVGLGLVAAQLVFSALLEPCYQSIQDRGLAGIRDSYRWQRADRSLPSAAHRQRAQALADQVRAAQQRGRRLFAPQRPWWAQLGPGAGARGHVGSMGLNDVPKASRQALRKKLRAKLNAGEYDDLWFEGSLASWWWLRPSLARNYRLAQRREGSDRVLPMVGFMSEAGMVTPYRAPQLWLERITPPVADPGAESLLDFEADDYRGFTSTGDAFGRAPARSVHRKLPAVGPLSGARLASSAAGVKGERGRGTLRSPALSLPVDAVSVSYRGGYAGTLPAGEGTKSSAPALVGAALVDAAGARLPLPLTGPMWGTEQRRVPLPAGWAGRSVHLELVDNATGAALFFDDLRVHRP